MSPMLRAYAEALPARQNPGRKGRQTYAYPACRPAERLLSGDCFRPLAHCLDGDALDHLRPPLLQRGQGKARLQHQPGIRARDQWKRSQREKSRIRGLQDALQAIPALAGDAPQLQSGIASQIEKHQRQIAIPQQQVRAAHCFRRRMAAHPEQPAQGIAIHGLRIEGIHAIDESSPLPVRRRLVHHRAASAKKRRRKPALPPSRRCRLSRVRHPARNPGRPRRSSSELRSRRELPGISLPARLATQ